MCLLLEGVGQLGEALFFYHPCFYSDSSYPHPDLEDNLKSCREVWSLGTDSVDRPNYLFLGAESEYTSLWLIGSQNGDWERLKFTKFHQAWYWLVWGIASYFSASYLPVVLIRAKWTTLNLVSWYPWWCYWVGKNGQKIYMRRYLIEKNEHYLFNLWKNYIHMHVMSQFFFFLKIES